jgi:hypothetical protein
MIHAASDCEPRASLAIAGMAAKWRPTGRRRRVGLSRGCHRLYRRARLSQRQAVSDRHRGRRSAARALFAARALR